LLPTRIRREAVAKAHATIAVVGCALVVGGALCGVFAGGQTTESGGGPWPPEEVVSWRTDHGAPAIIGAFTSVAQANGGADRVRHLLRWGGALAEV